MWTNPNDHEIEDYLKVLFRGHQAKYGKQIVPDSQLAKLLRRAESLPLDWDKSDESEHFVESIDGPGWYGIQNVLNKNELLVRLGLGFRV